MSPPAAGTSASAGKSWDSWSDSEDEFFECLSDQGEAEAPDSSRAEGRLQPCNNMTLLHRAEPLYVPVTQVSVSEPPPMRPQGQEPPTRSAGNTACSH